MSRTVLLVDDDEASQYIFGTVLRHHGYHVLEAWRASEGLRMVREHKPDLVVLDIGLPDMDGFEITRRLKADPETRGVPVLVATVHVFEHERQQAYEAGCDYFLGKPLEPRALASEVRRILEGEDAAPGSDDR